MLCLFIGPWYTAFLQHWSCFCLNLPLMSRIKFCLQPKNTYYVWFTFCSSSRFSIEPLYHFNWTLLKDQDHLALTISVWISGFAVSVWLPGSRLPGVENIPGFDSHLMSSPLSCSLVTEPFWSSLRYMLQYLSVDLTSQCTFIPFSQVIQEHSVWRLLYWFCQENLKKPPLIN